MSQHAGQLTTALPSEPTRYWPLNLPCGAGWWWSASNSCVASCHCPAARTTCTANSPLHIRQALASVQAVSRTSLFPRCPVPLRAGCWLRCQLRKYRDSALPACLAHPQRHDIVWRIARHASRVPPPRASWLGAIHARRATVAAFWSLSHHLTTPLRLSPTPYPAFTRPAAPRPKTSSLSVSVSPLTHGIPAVLRWPARGRPASRCKFPRYALSWGGCLGSGYRAEPASGGRGFCLFRHSPNRERDFYLDPCTVEEMMFGGSERGALGWNFSGAAGRGAVLIFRMVVGTSRSAFSFLVWFLDGGKCSVGTVV